MKLRDQLAQVSNTYKLPSKNAIKTDALTTTVSFVIPVFNSDQSIESCVATIVKQQRADLIREIVMVNDCSDDDSWQAMEGIRSAYPDHKIICIDNDTRRYAGYTRNRGIEACTGDLVCLIDSDILLPPDYLVQHAAWHEANNPCITFSLRTNVTSADEADKPVKTIQGDFRSSLLQEHTELRNAPFQFSKTHTLAELCLTCAVTYRRDDLVTVRGCPENFVGWGFNDTAMAAKVIALGRPIIPVFTAIVCHLEHPMRSGGISKKWAEFAKNKKRYAKMLDLPLEETCQYNIPALDI